MVFEEPAKERAKRSRKSSASAPSPRKTAARIQPPEPQEGAVGERIDEESGEEASWDEEAEFEDADDEWDEDQRHYDEGGAAAA